MTAKTQASDARLQGRVTAVHGRHYRVETADRSLYECVTRGKKGGMACGDHVRFSVTSAGYGAIEQTLPRKNLLYRSDRFRSKILAANVDHVFVVVAAVPTPDIDLLNRCLVACEAAGISVSIVVNKADLSESSALLGRMSAYEKLGYTLIVLSALKDIAPLRAALAEGTSILIGASGVGKSTLINALIPEAEIATQSISSALDTGKHTTTHTRLYHLLESGSLIDSPGMQEFGLWHLKAPELQGAFPEFRDKIGHCRFYNCRHLKEPGCAILDAVEIGEIQRDRWRVYRDLTEEIGKTLY